MSGFFLVQAQGEFDAMGDQGFLLFLLFIVVPIVVIVVLFVAVRSFFGSGNGFPWMRWVGSAISRPFRPSRRPAERDGVSPPAGPDTEDLNSPSTFPSEVDTSDPGGDTD